MKLFLRNLIPVTFCRFSQDSAIAMPVDMNDDEGDEATFIIDDPTSKFSKIRSSPKSKSKPTTPKRIDKKLTPRGM